jgi:hypothetical protein
MRTFKAYLENIDMLTPQFFPYAGNLYQRCEPNPEPEDKPKTKKRRPKKPLLYLPPPTTTNF